MLTTGNQNARKNGVRLGARFRAVAAIGFAGDDRRADHSFSLVVGSVQTINVEETQQMRTVFAQAFGKAGMVFVRQPGLRGNELIQLSFEGACSLGAGKGVQVWFFRFQPQGLLQQCGHLPGKVQCPAGFALAHIFQISEPFRNSRLHFLHPRTEWIVLARIINRHRLRRGMAIFMACATYSDRRRRVTSSGSRTQPEPTWEIQSALS